MINSEFKIILFNGGFAGDLIASLHNPDLITHFAETHIRTNPKISRLCYADFRKSNSYEDKLEYLKSIEHYGVCTSHDLELSLRLRKNTILLHCSDITLAEVLFYRMKRKTKTMAMTFEESIAWQQVNKKIYKRQIDLANIYNKSFLDDLGIKDTRSVKILEKWRSLNEKN